MNPSSPIWVAYPGTPESDSDSDATADERLALALLDAVQLEVAGTRLWRVCNRRIAVGPDRFMGLIEETRDQFDVMVVGDDYLWTLFPTFWDALTHILHTHDERSAQRSLGDTAHD